MATTTYSFLDVAVAFNHPSFGQYVAYGEGIGNISITPSTDKTSQDVAADGAIMVSKVPGDNGTIALQIQQTSGFNQWLLNLYNYLLAGPTSEWAQATITIRSPSMGDLIFASGVAFQNRAQQQYQAQGQQRTWNLMAASIVETNVA